MAKATGPRGADMPKHTDVPNEQLTRSGRTVGSTATTPLPPRNPGRPSFEPEATPQRRAADPDAQAFDKAPDNAPQPPARLSVEKSGR